MMRKWQIWRCFDHVKETFQDKGWEYGQDGLFDNEVVPLLTEFGDYRVVFFKWDPTTGECWFELRNETQRSMVYVRGVENIPTPEKSGALLESYGAPVKAVPNPKERPVYELPLAPVLKAG